MGKDIDKDPYDHENSLEINVSISHKDFYMIQLSLYRLVSLWVISSKQNYTANPKNYLAILKLP